MKLSITLTFTLILCLVSTSSPFAQFFNNTYDANPSEELNNKCKAATVTTEGIFIGIHDSDQNNYISKLNFDGDQLNIFYYNYPNAITNQAWSDCISSDLNNNILVCNWILNQTDSIEYGVITSMENSGEVLWQELFGDSLNNHRLQHLTSTSDGGVIAVGTAYRNQNNSEFFVVKTDNLGNEEWHTYLGSNAPYYLSNGISVSELNDNSGFIVSGKTRDSIDQNHYAAIYKIDNSGNEDISTFLPNWSESPNYNHSLDDQAASGILNCSNGGFVFTTTKNTEVWTTDVYGGYSQMVKLNENLDTLWVCDLESDVFLNPLDPIHEIIETPQGDFITVGAKSTISGTPKSIGRLYKVSAEGNLIWRRSFYHMNYGDNLLFDVDQMPNGGYLCSGWTDGYTNLGDSTDLLNAWVISVDSLGCLIPGCDSLSTRVTENDPIKLLVYPNPASQQINLSFSSFNPFEKSLIQLHDMQGNLVKEESGAINNSTYILDSSDLPNGAYFLSIRTGEAIKSQQIIIIH